MQSAARTTGVYKVSEDVVVREIAGELIIVPISSSVADLEDELYTLNETGLSIWKSLDGTRDLGQIARSLAETYEGPGTTIEKDVVGLVGALVERNLVVEMGPA
jgi:hypothetical protein